MRLQLRRVLGPGDKGSISVFLGEPREAGEFAGTVEVSFEITNTGDQPLRLSEPPYVEVVEGC